jgi:hypothetical protein
VTRRIQLQPHTRLERLRAISRSRSRLRCGPPSAMEGVRDRGASAGTFRPSFAGAVRIPSTRKVQSTTMVYPLVNSQRGVSREWGETLVSRHQHAAPVRCACTSRERAELHVA